MTKLAPIALLAAAAAALPATAADPMMQIEPGLWEFEVDTSNPFMSQGGASTQQQCIRQSDLDPERFQQDLGECDLARMETTDRSMDWAFTCEVEGGSAEGRGSFTTNDAGDTVDGEMVIEMGIPQMNRSFVMKNTWTGRRIGPCP